MEHFLDKTRAFHDDFVAFVTKTQQENNSLRARIEALEKAGQESEQQSAAQLKDGYQKLEEHKETLQKLEEQQTASANSIKQLQNENTGLQNAVRILRGHCTRLSNNSK